MSETVLLDIRIDGVLAPKEYPFRTADLPQFIDRLRDDGQKVIGLKFEDKSPGKTSMTVTVLCEPNE